MELRLARMHAPITSLGPGRRVGLWVQGCTIGCAGCMSTHTWDPTAGTTVDVEELVDAVVAVGQRDALDGVTVSGGEPFQQPGALRALLGGIRLRWPAADVLVYSGYTLAYLRRRHEDALALADAVVTGPFVASRPTDLPWRGSANQRLTVLSARAGARYAEVPTRPRLQVTVGDDAIRVTGIPRRGDLDEMRSRLEARGLVLAEVSW